MSLGIQISECTKCSLSETRINSVMGSGNGYADLLIIGEAPGQKEDELGLPFVCRSGALLTKMLESIGLSRHEDAYITNLVKCRPPDNRDPTKVEITACRDYLHQQIEIIKPKAILCLGRISARDLMEIENNVSSPQASIPFEFIKSLSV